MLTSFGWLALATVGCAAFAAGIVLWYLIAAPPLDRTTKVFLALGIGVLPIGAALIGNVAGYQATQSRSFCGSCHNMTPYAEDSEDPLSTSLAATHARNNWFGAQNCYRCHANYGMFGTVATKLSGMGHVWEYYSKYKYLTADEAARQTILKAPYSNKACLQCHSTELKGFKDVADHKGSRDSANKDKTSCASEGCHGPAHPFSKPKAEGGHS